jgi:hypothetical protein
VRRMAQLQLGGAPPETVLPEPPPEAAEALGRASAEGSRQALSAVAAGWPRYLAAWAALSRACEADDPVAAYAFARTGYHRGLDALRAAGWRGSGYVRWAQPPNRGFLECLESLGRLAGAIGEEDEAQRCALFLRQLDPEERGGESLQGRPGPGHR